MTDNILEARHPLSFYLAGPVTETIEQTYGPRLGELTRSEKLELIGFLGTWCSFVSAQAEEDPESDGSIYWAELEWVYEASEAVEDILNMCDDLDLNQAAILIGALASFVGDAPGYGGRSYREREYRDRL